jgi:mevalonate kinase
VKEFYSNGKLLLTGEYVVLDGALSLAIPTSYGQFLEVTSIDKPKITWKSLDFENHVWFESEFDIKNNKITASLTPRNDNDKEKRLLRILQEAKKLNPEFLNSHLGIEVTSKLDFPQNWGLGSSSTLINNIANWAKVDAYKLLVLTFGGSGYDIACAQYNFPITYKLLNENKRSVEKVDFNPPFKESLYFVYLNKKQNSRDGITHYKASTLNKTEAIKEISDITLKLINCSKISEFEMLIYKHENIIASIIKQVPVKEKLFADFNGSIKSLGAWGGDFVLVTSKENPKDYFNSKGYRTIIPYSKMIK